MNANFNHHADANRIHQWFLNHVRELMGLETSVELAQYLARTLDDMFGWDAFIYSERVHISNFYKSIYSVDIVDGKRQELDVRQHSQRSYDNLSDLHRGLPILINRGKPEEASQTQPGIRPISRFGDASRPSASLIFVPVMYNGQLFAVFSIQSYTPFKYSESCRDQVRLMADLIAPYAQRIQAETALQLSNDRYRQAIAQANAVPYERDYATGAITYMGEGIAEITGYSAEELTPDQWKSIVQEIVLQGDAAGLEKSFAIQESHLGHLNNWRAEYRLRRRDGQIRWVADSSINLFDQTGHCYGSLGIMQDITAQKRAAQLRDELSRVGRELSATTTRNEAAHIVAEAAGRLIGWDACFISLYNQANGKVSPLLSVDTIDGTRREFTEHYGNEIDPGPLYQKTIKDGAVLISNRTDDEPDEIHSFGDKSRRSESLIFALIHEADRIVGVFSIQSYTSGAYTDESLHTLQLLADYCGAAMTRAALIETMHERENRYRRAIAQASAVSYEHDTAANKYAYMGEGIAQLCGYTSEELTPQIWATLVQEVIPHSEPDSYVYSGDGKFERSGKRKTWRADYRIRTRTGQTRWISDSSISVTDARGTAISYIGLLTDITERRRALEINEALSSLGRDISAARTLTDAAQIVVDTADQLIGWDACFVSICNLGENVARNILNIDVVEGQRTVLPLKGVEFEPIGNLTLKTLNEGPQLILVGDRDQASGASLVKFGDTQRNSEALMFVPLKRPDHSPIGILSIQSYTKFAFAENDLRLLQTLADHCTAAFERILAEENRAESEKRATIMAALANCLNAARNARQAGEIIADVTEQLFKWDSFNLDLYDPDKDLTYDVLNYDTIDGKKSVFLPEDIATTPTKFGRRVLTQGAFLLLREPNRSASKPDDSSSVPFGDTQKKSASLMFVPARFSDRIVGILSIQSYSPHAFTKDNLDTLQTLADYCGGALERIRAESELRRERQRLSVFAETGRQLSAAATPREAAILVLEAAKTLIGWDCAYLALFNEAAQCFTPLVAYDIINGQMAEITKPNERWPLTGNTNTVRTYNEGKILILREPVAPDKAKVERPFGNVNIRSESLMFAPARRGDKVIGVLSIQSYTTNAYTPDDLDTLQALADHTSSALERAFAEAKVRVSERRSEALARLGRQLNSAESPIEAGRAIAAVAEELFQWDACFIDLYVPEDHSSFHILNIDTVDGVKQEFPQIHQGRHMTPMKERLLKEGPQLILRTEDDAQNSKSISTARFGQQNRKSMSLMYVPARKRDAVVGFISLQSYSQNAFTEDDLDLLQALADHCGGALERIRIETALANERQHISALAELGRSISAARTSAEAARLVLDTAQFLIGWDSAYLAIVNSENSIVTPVVSFDLVDGRLCEVSSDFPTGPLDPKGHAYKAIHDGPQILLRPDPSEVIIGDTPFGDTGRLSASLLFVPVRRGADVIGLISIQSYTPQAYSKADLDTLLTLADHCAGALERIEAEHALIEERHQLRTLIDNLPDSIYFKDRHGRFLINNLGHLRQLSETCGQPIASPADVAGKTDFDFFPAAAAKAFRDEEQCLMETGEIVLNREESIDAGDGQTIWRSATKVPLHDEKGEITGLVGITRDITALKEVQIQLQRAAFYDSLTGLANRSLFMDRLRHSLALIRRREGYKFALFFLDLDKFKDVNDQLGHLTGDELLRRVGERLKSNVRETDTVARLGGDEFTILLEDFQSFDQVRQVAERLLVDLSRPVKVGAHSIPTNASIGITTSSRGYISIEDILRDADSALYQAKEQGRGRYIIFGE